MKAGDYTAASTQDLVRAQARAWVVRLADASSTSDEHAAFDVWLAKDARHQDAYERALFAYNAAGELKDRLLSARLRPQTKSGWRGARLWMGGAVAAMAAALTLAVLPPQTPQAPATAQYQTAVAEHQNITLSDGSHLTLGAATTLEAHFTPTERRVVLSGVGDAFFDVVHDPSRPFVVETPRAEVRVLGTAFDVKSTPSLVRVAVSRGLVEVSEPLGLDTLLQSRRHRIEAGQEIVVGQAHARMAPTALVASTTPAPWRQGFLSYDNATLGEVIADANRYSARPIRLDSAELARIRVTASYPSDQVTQIIETLDASLPISIRDEGEAGVVIEAQH